MSVWNQIYLFAFLAGAVSTLLATPFFGWLALLFVILGLVAGVPVIAEFVTTGLVSKLPSTVLAVALVICGALSMTVGLVLDTVAKSQRKAWELEVYRATEERA